MKHALLGIILMTLSSFLFSTVAVAEATPTTSLYSLSATSQDGKPQPLSIYTGKVALVVNVASFCGFTKQYEGLQRLFLKYKDRGFVILGFPSNDFGAQEPGTDQEISTFCVGRFGVTFPIFKKSTVLGKDKNEAYSFLTQFPLATDGAKKSTEVSWNFEKFLVNKSGVVVDRFLSSVEPESDVIIKRIEALLNN